MQYPELVVQDDNFFTTDMTNVIANIEKGILTPVASDALEHLFNAYRFEEFGLFDDAIQEYDYALQKGAQHENVLAKRAEADRKNKS